MKPSLILILFYLIIPCSLLADSRDTFEASSLDQFDSLYYTLSVVIDGNGDATVSIKDIRPGKEGDNAYMTFVGLPDDALRMQADNSFKVELPENSDRKIWAVIIDLSEPPSSEDEEHVGGWVLIWAKSVTYAE